MKTQIDTVHGHIGALAVMSRQTEAAERSILENAEKLLAQVQEDIPEAAKSTMTATGAEHYQWLIAERGRLQQVIAQARVHLHARPE